MRFTDILMSSAHAFIVEGRSGEIRERFVRDFIKGLNCECEDVNARPCNNCPSCRQTDAGTSMDVIHMDKSGKTAYKVEDAASLIERIGMGSYGRHIIGVVDEADLLSEAIQNKLLKTLEEPEEGAVIILATANRDNLLRTVRSRCNIVRIADYIDGADADEEAELSEGISEVAEAFIAKARRAAGDRSVERTLFYESRVGIEKKIKSQEEAVQMLGAVEDAVRDMMVGTLPEASHLNRTILAGAIDSIEAARMDIYKGMKFSSAIKRLWLVL